MVGHLSHLIQAIQELYNTIEHRNELKLESSRKCAGGKISAVRKLSHNCRLQRFTFADTLIPLFANCLLSCQYLRNCSLPDTESLRDNALLFSLFNCFDDFNFLRHVKHQTLLSGMLASLVSHRENSITVISDFTADYVYSNDSITVAIFNSYDFFRTKRTICRNNSAFWRNII